MYTTRLLDPSEFHLYGRWLKELDQESRDTYFGIATTPEYIDQLMEKIQTNPDQHNFLVAYKVQHWFGVIHLAEVSDTSVEFGISVDPDHRCEGIASILLDEAVIWVRNRGYETLYLHCISRNKAMQHLCTKHGLSMHTDHGDVDVATHLAPPSLFSFGKEYAAMNKNMFFVALNQMFSPYDARAIRPRLAK